MKRTSLAVVLLLSLTHFCYGQSRFAGSWVVTGFPGAKDPNIFLDVSANGSKLTGTISRPLDMYNIEDGTASGETITFKVTLPGAARIISFTGKLSGDGIAFTRTVKVRDEASNVGAGIFGAKGPMQFTANRDKAPATAMSLIYGHWQMNPAKSTYGQGPVPNMIEEEFVSCGAGAFRSLFITVDQSGIPKFMQSYAKVDGKDYPFYTSTSVAALLNGEKPALNTISVRAIDSRTIEITSKANSVVTDIHTLAVSTDGDTYTDNVKVMNAEGKQTAINVAVYDRLL